jgi:hypothetical protein
MWLGVMLRLFPAPLIQFHSTCCFLFTLIFPAARLQAAGFGSG